MSLVELLFFGHVFTSYVRPNIWNIHQRVDWSSAQLAKERSRIITSEILKTRDNLYRKGKSIKDILIKLNFGGRRFKIFCLRMVGVVQACQHFVTTIDVLWTGPVLLFVKKKTSRKLKKHYRFSKHLESISSLWWIFQRPKTLTSHWLTAIVQTRESIKESEPHWTEI